MKLLVCGSRDWTDREAIRARIVDLAPSVIIEGEARGADRMAREIGEELGIPVQKFPANWDRFGKAAGPIRNEQMLREGKPDRVLAFLLPTSIGSVHMIAIAKAAGIPTEVIKA